MSILNMVPFCPRVLLKVTCWAKTLAASSDSVVKRDLIILKVLIARWKRQMETIAG